MRRAANPHGHHSHATLFSRRVPGRDFRKELAERFQARDSRDHLAEALHRHGNMLKEVRTLPHMAQKAVGPECLHETLHGAMVVDFAKFGWHFAAVLAPSGHIVREQRITFLLAEIDIRIVEHRGEIVLHQAWAHSLEVDQTGRAIFHHHILRLEIPVNQDPLLPIQLRGDFIQAFSARVLGQQIRGHLIVTPEAMFDEVVLFPAIELPIELRLKFLGREATAVEIPRV